MSASAMALERPLCVDCDGTLVRTDLLHESFLLLLRSSFADALLAPLWLLKGRANLKLQIAQRVMIDAATLPYNEELLAYLREQHAQGRSLVLATASARPFAEAIAAHLGIFDAVEATDDETNLSSHHKAERLCERFGEGGYDYVGNSQADLPVWRSAANALLVGAPRGVAQRARAITQVAAEFSPPSSGLRAALKAVRLHQWLKNLMIFVPLAAAHRLGEGALLAQAVLAFIAFGFCASSVYVLNDMLDIQADRQHARKRRRPFASGELAVWQGFLLCPLLLAMSCALLPMLPPAFALVLAIYYVLTLSYSLWLKSRVIVDVMVLASLYTLRVVAGAAATGIRPSFWLLAFSIFMFLSLALVKRYSEMHAALAQNRTVAAGRGYRVSDLPVLMSLGCACGCNAVLVLALFVNSPEISERYPRRELLWLMLPLLLYWISRVWMKAQRGEMHDDPVVFAVRDWQSEVIALLMALILVAASATWALPSMFGL
jgi:4-hydroxybenzoate polyprenyltransferase/phosphoserine phosphatase